MTGFYMKCHNGLKQFDELLVSGLVWKTFVDYRSFIDCKLKISVYKNIAFIREIRLKSHAIRIFEHLVSTQLTFTCSKSTVETLEKKIEICSKSTKFT